MRASACATPRGLKAPRDGLLAILLLACGPSSPPPGPTADGVHVVTASPAGAYEADLEAYGEGLVVGWYDTRAGQADIYVRRLTADGVPAAPAQRVTATVPESYEVDLAASGEDLAVAWYERESDGAAAPWLALLDAAGVEQWRVQVSTDGRIPVVLWDGEAFFCAWVEDGPTDASASAVWAGRWRRDGSVLQVPRVLAPAGRTTWNLNADAANGQVWVAFDALAGTVAEELFAVRAVPGAPDVRQLTPDDGVASKYPDVAFGAGRVALTWHDVRDGNQEVYLAAGAGLTRALADGARRVTETPGASFGAYVAWNGDRLGLAWSDDTPGEAEIHVQAFGPDGAPAGGARRLTDNPTASLVPSIVAWGDGFALAWNEFASGGAGPEDTDHDDDARSQIAVAIVE